MRDGRPRALRSIAAAVAIAALGALAWDLIDKASVPRFRTPGVTPAPEPDEGERRRRPRQLVHVDDPTVYEAQDDLARCASPRRRMEPADAIAAVSARVERLRGLSFDGPVDTRLVSRAEVGRRFLRGYLRGYGAREAARDARVLAALRLVPEGTDVRAVTSQLLAGGVAGFYNPRADRLFAATATGAPTAYEEVVLAHELGHALVDQALGMPKTSARDPMRADEMLARQVLVEGDATLLMSKYAARRLTPGEYAAFASRFTQRPLVQGGVPYYLERTSEFPYYEGLLFACREWRRRGWDGVDALYGRPPRSTAEVLFPSRYRSGDRPRHLQAPPSPGDGWTRVPPRTFGAFDVMLLLENADLLSEGETVPGAHVDAVRGWHGGVLSAWLRGDATTLHLALADAGVQTAGGRRRRLCRAVTSWLRETFPDRERVPTQLPATRAWRTDGELAVLRCDGGAIELVKGPSAGTVWRLLFS